MAEIPLLDGSKVTPETEFTRLSEEDQIKLAELAAATQTEPDKQPVRTAFILFQTEDGVWMANHNLGLVEEIALDHSPTEEDMWTGVSSIKRDIEQIQTARKTQMVAMQTAQMMAQQQENARIAQQLQGQLGKVR